MASSYVNTNLKEKIFEIEFYNASANALTLSQLKSIEKAIKDCEMKESVHLIHLKSNGDRVFCSGALLDDLLIIDNMRDAHSFFMGFASVINAMRQSSKLIICSVQGKVVGGGLGIVSASDYVFAVKTASVRLSELQIGIGPFVIEPSIERKIGLSKTTELILNPTHWKTADWCERSGLYNDVKSSLIEVEEYMNMFLKKICSYHLKSLKSLKRVLWKNTDHWDELLKERAHISATLLLSSEVKRNLLNLRKK